MMIRCDLMKLIDFSCVFHLHFWMFRNVQQNKDGSIKLVRDFLMFSCFLCSQFQ